MTTQTFEPLSVWVAATGSARLRRGTFTARPGSAVIAVPDEDPWVIAPQTHDIAIAVGGYPSVGLRVTPLRGGAAGYVYSAKPGLVARGVRVFVTTLSALALLGGVVIAQGIGQSNGRILASPLIWIGLILAGMVIVFVVPNYSGVMGKLSGGSSATDLEKALEGAGFTVRQKESPPTDEAREARIASGVNLAISVFWIGLLVLVVLSLIGLGILMWLYL